MSVQPITLTFYFDFLCPFAYRTTLWIDQVKAQLGDNLEITWKYFSLEQVNTPADSDWKLWEQTEDYIPSTGKVENRSLLAFWAAEAARHQGPDAFTRTRRALYRARHHDKLHFAEREAVQAIVAQAGIDMDRFAIDFTDRRLLDAIRRDHEEARATYQVFGVPTLCYDDDNAIYIKLAEVPPADDVLPFFNELRHSFTARRWLGEIKRPNP